MRRLSVKSKLMMTVGGMGVVSAIAFALVAQKAGNFVEQDKKEAIKLAAQDLIGKLDRAMASRYNDARAFGSSEASRSLDPSRVIPFMNDMMTSYSPNYRLFMVVNRKGRVIAVNTVDREGRALSTQQLIGKDYSQATWFATAASGSIRAGAAFVEDMHADPDVAEVYGGDGKAMGFTVPIRSPSTGEILGVWTSRVAWEDLVGGIIREETRHAQGERLPRVYISLFDGKGKSLVVPEGTGSGRRIDFPKGSEVLVQSMEDRIGDRDGKFFEALAPSRGFAAFPGLGWVVSVQAPDEDPFHEYYRAAGIAVLLLLSSMSLFALLGMRRLTTAFHQVLWRLGDQSEELKRASSQLTSASQELASSTHGQSTALQQTASSIEQITTMIHRSSDNAQRSLKVAATSHDTASRGKHVIDDMITAIEQISDSNLSIQKQIEEGNAQLTGIIKLISEIGSKTKVINDIAFQTKLLSFNASVEAARAGEHGKGFAVVADEVGNLAQLSGSAAKDIGEMLSTSTQTVQGIIDAMRGRVEHLIEDARQKVEQGVQVARECETTFEEILHNEAEMNSIINEITNASHEQSQGVGEINKAVAQLEDSTTRNSEIARQTDSFATAISNLSQTLRGQVDALRFIVEGGRGGIANPLMATNATTTAAMDESRNVLPFRGPGNDESQSSPSQETKNFPSESDPRFQEI